MYVAQPIRRFLTRYPPVDMRERSEYGGHLTASLIKDEATSATNILATNLSVGVSNYVGRNLQISPELMMIISCVQGAACGTPGPYREWPQLRKSIEIRISHLILSPRPSRSLSIIMQLACQRCFRARTCFRMPRRTGHS